jgi:glycosyltransferase involved in cell wall biosynthesis
MLKNQDIICFGFADWDNPYRTNQHHLMERLSRTNKVLFIESLGLRRPTFQKKDVARILRRLKGWSKGVRKKGENLYVFSPLVVPFHRYSIVRRFNRWFLKSQLDHIVRKYAFKCPIIWSYIPNAVEFLGRWNEKLSIYHCVDDLSANPLIPRETVLALEKQFLSRVNVVFTTSKELYLEKSKHNPRTYYMPNVAEFGHFHKAMHEDTAIPEDIACIPSPRLGFIGAISRYKLDFDMIHDIAIRHPEWSLVLIGAKGEGEKAVDLGKLEQAKNIHIPGGRPYAALPGYLKGFDVCLLPNVLNEYTRNMFPMKFFEYMAAGKPIVATELAALAEFKDYFYVSRTPKEFEDNICKALKENNPAVREERVKLAKKYTWETRIDEMSAVIEKALPLTLPSSASRSKVLPARGEEKSKA